MALRCERCPVLLEPRATGWLVCPRCDLQRVDPAAEAIELEREDGTGSLRIPLPSKFRQEYKLEKLLGRGGMGAVFLAQQLSVQRPVALKVILDLQDQDQVRRFRREARILAQLEHGAVVRVYDTGAIGACPYLAMELVNGGSLRDRMREGEAMELADVLDLLLPVLSGVDYCHGQAVVHRDLKPDNILLTEGGEPRIADFGLATCRDMSTRLTAAQSFVGTPHYVAPEQVSGREGSGTADIYALGVILFEMLAGRRPFGGTVPEVLQQHLYATPPRLAHIRRDLPPEVDRVVQRCLAKEPADRFARASVLAFELARAAGRGRSALEVRYAHVSRGAASLPPRGRPALAAAAAGLTGLALVAALALTHRVKSPDFELVSPSGPPATSATTRGTHGGARGSPGTPSARRTAERGASDPSSGLSGGASGARSGSSGGASGVDSGSPGSSAADPGSSGSSGAVSGASGIDSGSGASVGGGGSVVGEVDSRGRVAGAARRSGDGAGGAGGADEAPRFGSHRWVQPMPTATDVSADGRWVAARSGTRDNALLRNAHSGEVVAEVGLPGDQVAAVRFTPDGNGLGLFFASGRLAVVRASSDPGEPRVTTPPLPGTVTARTSFALSATAGGAWLGAVLEGDSVCVVGTKPWEARRLRPTLTPHPHARVEADAATGRVACLDGKAVLRIWDAASGAIFFEGRLPGLTAVTPWAWSAATGRIAFPVSGSDLGWQEVRLCRIGDPGPPELLKPEGSLASVIDSLGFSADGAWVVLGSQSFMARDHLEWWRVDRAPKRTALHMLYTALEGVRVSPDARWTLASYKARRMVLVGREDPDPLPQLNVDVGHEGPISALSLEMRGAELELVSAAADETVRRWVVATGRALASASGTDRPAVGVRLCPCGQRAVLTGPDGGLLLAGRERTIKSLAVPAAFALLATAPSRSGASCTHPLLVLDRTGHAMRCEPGASGPARALAPAVFAPSGAPGGSRAPAPASASVAPGAPAGAEIAGLDDPLAKPGRVVAAPGGEGWLVEVTANAAGVHRKPPYATSRKPVMTRDEWLPESVVWWFVPPGAAVREVTPGDGALLALGFGPGPGEHQEVVVPPAGAATRLRAVRLVRRADGTRIRKDALPELPCPTTCGALSPDGALLFAAGDDAVLRVLEGGADHWRVAARLAARASAMAFDAAGRHLAVGTWEGTLAVIEVDAREE